MEFYYLGVIPIFTLFPKLGILIFGIVFTIFIIVILFNFIMKRRKSILSRNQRRKQHQYLLKEYKVMTAENDRIKRENEEIKAELNKLRIATIKNQKKELEYKVSIDKPLNYVELAKVETNRAWWKFWLPTHVYAYSVLKV